ncbi:MAG TPA: hypothetical protein VGQ81_05585 [Acidobacteriota bacterium]|nr:hypothetical protein [Acidobacteriota bacterium]
MSTGKSSRGEMDETAKKSNSVNQHSANRNPQSKIRNPQSELSAIPKSAIRN